MTKTLKQALLDSKISQAVLAQKMKALGAKCTQPSVGYYSISPRRTKPSWFEAAESVLGESIDWGDKIAPDWNTKRGILAAIKNNPGFTIKKLAEHFGLTVGTREHTNFRIRISKLEKSGDLYSIQDSPKQAKMYFVKTNQ